jgi:hypothetical protein
VDEEHQGAAEAMKCDYCERVASHYITYEGIHHVCEKHWQTILELAGKRLLGTDFQDALEKRRGK